MRNLKRSLLTIVHAWADQAQVAVATFGMWSRGVIQMFREAGATTPERAQPFRARSLMEKFAFKQLLTVGAIREPAPGRYYLDERSLETLRRQSLPHGW